MVISSEREIILARKSVFKKRWTPADSRTTAIYIQANATDNQTIGIHIQAIAADGSTITAYIQTIGIYLQTIGNYRQTTAIYSQAMPANIGEIRGCSRATAARSRAKAGSLGFTIISA